MSGEVSTGSIDALCLVQPNGDLLWHIGFELVLWNIVVDSVVFGSPWCPSILDCPLMGYLGEAFRIFYKHLRNLRILGVLRIWRLEEHA